MQLIMVTLTSVRGLGGGEDCTSYPAPRKWRSISVLAHRKAASYALHSMQFTIILSLYPTPQEAGSLRPSSPQSQ